MYSTVVHKYLGFTVSPFSPSPFLGTTVIYRKKQDKSTIYQRVSIFRIHSRPESMNSVVESLIAGQDSTDCYLHVQMVSCQWLNLFLAQCETCSQQAPAPDTPNLRSRRSSIRLALAWVPNVTAGAEEGPVVQLHLSLRRRLPPSAAGPYS